MINTYKKKLIELAKEVHELQLKETKNRAEKENLIETNWNTMQLNSKINFLIGFILGLDEEI